MSDHHKPDLARIAFILSTIILAGVIVFAIGFYSGHRRNSALHHVVVGAVKDVRLVMNELQAGAYSDEPVFFLQPAHQSGSGVTINRSPSDGKLVLLSGFFDGSNEIRLIRRDGSIVAHWPVKFSELFPDASHMPKPPESDWHTDLHGAVIHPDGSIVFNFEYGGTVRLGRCGEKLWSLAHPTHHSIEFAEGGGYWIPGRRYRTDPDPQSFPPFTRVKTERLDEDLILRVSEDGDIKFWKSVPQILYDNGLEPLLTAIGSDFRPEEHWDGELLHLNQISELPRRLAGAFPQFEAGDLVLSIRDYNLVLVVDPDDWHVKWHQVGPWRRQHDAEFEDNGTISVFNNNAYLTDLPYSMRSNPAVPRVSNILEVDPRTGDSVVVYGQRPGQEFFSTIRGKQKSTPGGGHLVTEVEAGRVFEIDAQGRTVWEYVNRYDTEQVLELTEARLYPETYFSVDDWSCPKRVDQR